MPVTKSYDKKKGCYHIAKTERNIKKYAGQIGRQLGAGLLVDLAKQVMKARLKWKNYCKEDIDWLMKQI